MGREHTLLDSMHLLFIYLSIYLQSFKATRNFSVSDWSKNFEVVFQDEEGELSCDFI